MRAGTWPGWELDHLCGGDIQGKTIGILGFGRIGRGVARRSQGFHMRVLYNDAVRAPAEIERELHAEFVDRDRLFAESDFISVHVPLMPETRHLINAANLAKMKSTAYLVNTSRGPVVDEAALGAALAARHLAGAALDVFENEPKAHPSLVARTDVILTPHIASASIETRTRMAVMAAENVVALFDGAPPAERTESRGARLRPRKARVLCVGGKQDRRAGNFPLVPSETTRRACLPGNALRD